MAIGHVESGVDTKSLTSAVLHESCSKCINVVKNPYLFRITFGHIFDKKVLVSHVSDQVTVKKVIVNVQNIQENVLNKF